MQPIFVLRPSSRYRGSPGRGSSGQGGAGSRRVHGAVFWYVQRSVQIVHVHQGVQVLGLSRRQHVGLDTVHFAQLEIRADGISTNQVVTDSYYFDNC